MLAAGLALAVAAVLLGRVVHARERALLEQGRHVAATVIGVSPSTLVDAGRAAVTFELDGRRHTAELPVNVELEAVEAGDTLTVAVDPTDPDRVRGVGVGGRPSGAGFPVVIAGMLGGAGTALGAVAWLRTRRWRRVLAEHPWQRTTFRYREMQRTFLRPVLEVEDAAAGGARLLAVAATPRWLLRHLQVRGPGELLVAGPPEGPFVVAPLSRLELYGARPPRHEAEARSWRRALRPR